MQFVDNQGVTDPRVNLAIEEHLLRNVERIGGPLLLFYINEPAVIIGRNQNTLEEIDPDYIERQGIRVVRRLSGGGAVFHDLGNLNFSFITPGKEDLHNFNRFTAPVIEVLGRLGVEAELRGKSDIFADGKKISGNAQYSTTTGMFSHGTLLFDTNIETMLKALNPRQVQVESKAVQSVRNFVTNIRELLPEQMEIDELKQAILEGIFALGEVRRYTLTGVDWQQIWRLSTERYGRWEWNYGRSPKFNVRKSERLPAGKIDARIEIEQGQITGLIFYGDFAGKRPVDELAQQLIGCRYDRQSLAAALAGVDVGAYFGDVAVEVLLELLY